MKNLGWLIAAAASAYACALIAPAATPIDRALPLIAVLVTLIAWSADAVAVQVAVPLLMIAAVSVADERLRLLTYGVIAAIACCHPERERGTRAGGVIAIVALLRWIPLDTTHAARELIILLGALLVLRATRSAPAAILIAAATPLFPLKALAFPFLIAALAALLPQRFRLPAAFVFAALIPFARYSFSPMLLAAGLAMLCATTELPAKVVTLLLIVVFAWSGAAIHALPVVPVAMLLALTIAIALLGRTLPIVATAAGLTLLFCMPATQTFDKTRIDTALAPSQALMLDVAPSRRVVVTASGANISSMRDGTLGTIEAFDGTHRVIATRPIAIGDVADWGFLRREHLFASHNRLPRDPSWRLIGYGAESWFTGAGRVTIDAPRHIESLRITANVSLPRIASLQIESVELPRR